MGTEIEVLAVGNCLLKKSDQNATLENKYEQTFERD
jgi:hypothetical protein